MPTNNFTQPTLFTDQTDQTDQLLDNICAELKAARDIHQRTQDEIASQGEYCFSTAGAVRGINHALAVVMRHKRRG